MGLNLVGRVDDSKLETPVTNVETWNVPWEGRGPRG